MNDGVVAVRSVCVCVVVASRGAPNRCRGFVGLPSAAILPESKKKQLLQCREEAFVFLGNGDFKNIDGASSVDDVLSRG